jgi:xanthine dehydrogenase accessory factor
MKNIYLKIPEIKSASQGLVLATVTGSSGSTPQKPGSSALFNRNGLIEGTVGGGIAEGKVTELAKTCSITKESGYLHFLLNQEITNKEEAICGGELFVLVDADPLSNLPVYEKISESVRERIPGVLITFVTTSPGSQIQINRYWMTKNDHPSLPVTCAEKIESEVTDILSSDGAFDFRKVDLSAPDEAPASVCFLEKVFPAPQLIIAGAGHIGKALSHIGKMLNFDVTVIDDRIEYANKDNLPDADHIIVKNIGEAMQEVPKRPDVFIVIVTRGHSDDANALKPCIGSDAAYVGMIGSKGKVAKMHTEFIKNKWATEEEWGKIFAPVGLDINSKSVEEIAISIAAQLVMIRNIKY